MGETTPSEVPRKPSRWSYQGHSNRFRYAIISALAVEIALVAGLIWVPHAQKKPKQPPKVISVQMVHLPPPPPPKPVIKPVPQPPKPVTPPVPVVHRPAPLPVKPPTPPKPVEKPVEKPTPPAPVSPPIVPPPPPVKSVPTIPATPVYSGIGAYGSGARSLVRNNVHLTAIIKRLGLKGTVMVSFKVPPAGGKAIDVTIIGGSQNPLIRKAAMNAVENSTFPAFSSHMPPHPLSFTIPIDIS